MSRGLSLEELEAQAGGLLPERVEMKRKGFKVGGALTATGGSGGGGGTATATATSTTGGIVNSATGNGGNGGTVTVK